MNNKTNVRFCDIGFGTEFYFCDPTTVGDHIKLCRFRKIMGGSFTPVRMVNMTTGRNVRVRDCSTTWTFPVWPQKPALPPELKKIDHVATDLIGRCVTYLYRPCLVNSVWVKDGALYVALSPSNATGPIVEVPVTALSI